jgi:hypothetical protein
MYIHVRVELVAILSYCLHLKDVTERKSLLATLNSTIVNSLKPSKDTTETESEVAENSSWDQANIRQKTCFGWEK